MFNPSTKKIKIKDINITSDQLPSVLDELGLMPLFIRSFIERINCSEIKPSDEDQYNNLQLFMRKERIGSQEELEHWLKINRVDEKSLSIKLFRLLQVKVRS